MDNPTIYKIALSLLQNVNAETIRVIAGTGISFEEFFELNMPDLESRLGTACRLKFQNSERQEALFRARKEYEFVKRHLLRVLFLLDDDYPPLLRETVDAPVVLYVLGNADLSVSPVLNLVGTRKCTGYGMAFCKQFVADLAPYFPDALIVSGLAYGIDSAAHQAALDNNLRTAAVVAHGLDMIYPAANRDLARRIIAAGGALISEYPSGTRPFQGNFLQRNRIVAGLSEATIVVESEIRGGAMSTANQAFSYSREVFAVPGRCTDSASSGCNYLIARNKANIYTSIGDFLNLMNWKIPAIGTPAPPKNLFPELDGDMEKVYNVIKSSGATMPIDEIHIKTGLSMPALMAALTDLEFEGIISKLPGARYECS